MYGSRESVDDGGLISYGVDTSVAYRHAAIFIDKILRGANPGDLPIEQPTIWSSSSMFELPRRSV
jgi:putative ABC transport system substrate-binding protein